MKLQSTLIILFSLISITFLTVFFYYPFFSILKDTFSTGENIIKSITDSINLEIWKFTFLEATVSTVFTLIIGLPAGYIFGKYNFPFKRFFLS